MGFLDNSGDIILDAVLTDTGRKRLARGDCSFNIAKFALGDDEIDYSLYNKNHANGSPYYDLEILQTPVLEAFTNNTSLMNSRLLSLTSNNIFYLPIMKIFDYGSSRTNALTGPSYIIAVDKATQDVFQTSTAGIAGAGAFGDGILNGYTGAGDNRIQIDQGIDNVNKPSTIAINPELYETTYIIQLDNRLGTIMHPHSAGVAAQYSFLDDDQIAHYYLEQGSGYVRPAGADEGEGATALLGSLGSRLAFRLKASVSLESSTAFFDQIGSSNTTTAREVPNTHGKVLTSYRYIDSTIRCTGVETGYTKDISVRFVKAIT